MCGNPDGARNGGSFCRHPIHDGTSGAYDGNCGDHSHRRPNHNHRPNHDRRPNHGHTDHGGDNCGADCADAQARQSCCLHPS